MARSGAARIFVVGSNHRSSTALLRDKLFVDEAMLPHALERLRAAGIDQALILSTCDRTEIQAVCPAADWRRDFLVPGRAGRRPAMRRKRAPK